MMIKNAWKGLWVLVFLISLNSTVFAVEQDPRQFVMNNTNNVLGYIKEHQAEFKEDPAPLYAYIFEKVLPHFDFRKMTRSAVGKFWRKATTEEKDQLIVEFRQLLLRTYAVALLNFSGEKVEFPAIRLKADAKKVMIPTIIHKNGPKIPVNYRLYAKDGQWKVYDIVIDGISLVSNYRGTFRAQINKGGIAGLIKTLSNKNNKTKKSS